mmetsp:Transcript_64010/g.149096  ORF Transcript_64010/g.149096 Transcript_64010/m.149096 type:complete len:170 (+) Transcript_64010:430-939(+)
MLVAKSYRGNHLAQLQLVARRVRKEYICLCHGTLAPAPRLFEAPLRMQGRLAELSDTGKAARTELLSAAHLDSFSLTRLRLHTGRTHQIRAHLAAAGWPLVGDVAYGGQWRPWCTRNFLHACRLALDLGDGPLEAVAELPPDLLDSLKRLGPMNAHSRALARVWVQREG